MKTLLKILRRLKILAYFNFEANLNLNATNFKIPIIRGLGLRNLDMTEIWMIELIKLLYSLKEGAFMDIGVNIGQSLLKVKSVNRNVEYIGFEPNPHCVTYVEDLIRCNGFKDTIVLPSGLSNKAGLLELNFFQKWSADSSASLDENLRPHKKIYYKKVVQVIDYSIIESIIPEKVGLVKIDVEGHELFVLQGIQKLLMQKRPILLLEILPVTNGRNTERLERQNLVEILFKEIKYKITRIKKDSKGHLKYIEFLDVIGNSPNLADSDYIVVPAELETEFRKVVTLAGYTQKSKNALVN